MILVTRRVEQRKRLGFCERFEFTQKLPCSIATKLCAIAPDKLLPTLRPMTEPFTKPGARTELFEPTVYCCRVATKTSWPEPINKDATPVRFV